MLTLYILQYYSMFLIRKSDAQQELEDFTEESRQLECELEASLKQSENEIRDLRLTVRNLQAELESSRVFYFIIFI